MSADGTLDPDSSSEREDSLHIYTGLTVMQTNALPPNLGAITSWYGHDNNAVVRFGRHTVMDDLLSTTILVSLSANARRMTVLDALEG